MEIWKFVKGFKSNWGRYRVSNLGRLKGPNGREFYLRKSKKGYLSFRIVRESDGKEKFMQMHRLIALTFIPNPDNLPQVNHVNCIKTDNRVCNLQWCTNAENMHHAKINGLRKNKKGGDSKLAQLTNEQAAEIRSVILNKGGQGPITRKDLAERYCVSLHVIKDIRAGRSYCNA